MSDKLPVGAPKPSVNEQIPTSVGNQPQQLKGVPLPSKIVADITALRKENAELKNKLAELQKNIPK